MSSYREFTFDDGDDHVGGNRFKRFKGKTGESYRLSFCWWSVMDENGVPDWNGTDDRGKPSKPQFVGGPRHYVNGVGYVMDTGPEMQKLLGGPPKDCIATIVVAWPTLKGGGLDKSRLAAGDVEVLPWTFGGDKFRILKKRHSEFPFSEYDIAIDCTDGQYQKMDISPARENLYRKLLGESKFDQLTSSIAQQCASIAVNMQTHIGADLTTAQLREKMGGGGGGGGGSRQTDFGDAAVEDVDKLLGDIVG